MTLKWRRMFAEVLTRLYYNQFCFVGGTIVPEPRAGSNSKARVHPNFKNPRLRPLQVNPELSMSVKFINMYFCNSVAKVSHYLRDSAYFL